MHHAREDRYRTVPGWTVALALLTGWLAPAGCGGGEPGQPGHAPAAAPIAVSTAAGGWLQQARARIAAGEYRVRTDGASLRAFNRAQDLHATWRGDGLTLLPRLARGGAPSIGLRSLALGRGSAPAALTGRAFRLGGCRS